MDEQTERELNEWHEAAYAEALEQAPQSDKERLGRVQEAYLAPVAVCITPAMVERMGDAHAMLVDNPSMPGANMLRDILLDNTELMNEVLRLKKQVEWTNKKVWNCIQTIVYNTLTKIKHEPKWMMDNHLHNFDSQPRIIVNIGMDTPSETAGGPS